MQKIYLASKSPRRQELLRLMGLEYTLYIKDIDESYPSSLDVTQIAEFIAKKKADAFPVSKEGIILTADTIVILENEVLGKPQDENDAFNMLKKLSGKKHQVITGVCIASSEKQSSFSVITDVYFRELSDEEIKYYVAEYKPLDKAGAYGIQEWIGAVGITKIDGSYTNVVGLPTERLHKELKSLGLLN